MCNAYILIAHMTVGIYVIHCKSNRTSYVGSSIEIERRWMRHRWELNNDAHHNVHLQAAWKKYGAKVFTFTIVEVVGRQPDLHVRENAWIDACSKKFNSERIALPRTAYEAFLKRKRGLEAVANDEIAYDDNVMHYFERYVGLGPVHASKLLGVSYIAYAAYRSGRRDLPPYHLAHMLHLIEMPKATIDAYIAKDVYGQ